MSHETPTLNAPRRDRTGSRYAKRLRDAGQLPAVVYGHKTEPVSVSVDAKETIRHLRLGTQHRLPGKGGARARYSLAEAQQP